MPRKKLTNTKSVNELAEEYIEAKDRELEAGKIVKSLGPTLKTAMKQSDVEVLETSLGRLVYSKRVSESFNEESLIEYLKSLGTSGEMHIPLPFTVENNPIGRNYMILKYVNDNKFTIGYHNDGIDTIGGRGLWTMYGMY
jgi:hypothetical protein